MKTKRKNIFKSLLALTLALIMVLGVAPISELAGVDWASLFAPKAEAAKTYKVGDIVTFGSYPQGEVTNSKLVATLNKVSKKWVSYGYYSGNGKVGSMVQGDWMKYADFTYNGTKYRAVTFSKYRPVWPCDKASALNAEQDHNGYTIKNIYYFKYSPLTWRVLNPSTGLVLCENVIDSQAYSNTMYIYGKTELGDDIYWNDIKHSNYANNYATSSIRKWLNDDFYNTAFTSTQKSNILTSKLDNKACSNLYSEYDSEITYDKVFLPSFSEMQNTSYGFPANTYISTARKTRGTDYAKCQGLGYGAQILRTASDTSKAICGSANEGSLNSFSFVSYTSDGVRPAIRISDLSKTTLLLLNSNEIYSFRNSDSDFGKKCKYGMIDSHIKKLSKYVDKIYSGSVWSVAYGAIINCNIALARKEAWDGSCHGMAVTTVLDKVGKINFNENFAQNADTMSEVQKPKDNKTVMSAINYYHLAQEIPAIERGKFYNMKSSEAAKGLKELVQAAKNNKLTLFSYRFRSEKKIYGHSIVVIGYEEMSNGNHRLVVYDNRYSSAYSYIDINSKYTSCIVNGREKALSFNFITNFDTYDQIDIDGANNVYRAPAKIDSEVQSTEELPSRIKIDAVGEVTVKNAEGEELVVKDGETEGTMQVKNVSFVCNSDSEGNPAAATIVIDVENSKSFTFTSTDNNMNVAVCSPGIFADVNSVNADSVKIEENEGIFVSGDNIDVEAALSAKNNYCDMVGISGSAEKDMSMTYSDDDINIDGVKGDCTVDVYSDTVNFDTVDFESAYDSITVSDNGSGKVGLMDVKASSKNDGVYDINLAESTPDREVTLTLNDKNDVLHVGDSYVQEYSATADWKIYNISWTSSDDTVAEVDEDGVIGAVGCGKAEITATAYDEEGNVLSSDTIEITVVGESNVATGITLAAPTSPIPVGGSYQLVAAAQPDGASLPDLVWASSDPSVASVDENGLVKALSVGTATISVTDTASNLSAEVEIDTVQVIDFGDGGTTIKVGEKLIYTPVIQEDYVDYHYRWSSSDPSVVTVEPNEGELTGIKEGTATITMTLVDDDGNIIASSDFTVTVEKKDGFFKILFRIITAPFRAIINLFKKLFGK